MQEFYENDIAKLADALNCDFEIRFMIEIQMITQVLASGFITGALLCCRLDERITAIKSRHADHNNPSLVPFVPNPKHLATAQALICINGSYCLDYCCGQVPPLYIAPVSSPAAITRWFPGCPFSHFVVQTYIFLHRNCRCRCICPHPTTSCTEVPVIIVDIHPAAVTGCPARSRNWYSARSTLSTSGVLVLYLATHFVYLSRASCR